MIIRRRSYDYIFGFNLGALTDMVPTYIAKRFYKKPTLLWVQDLWPDSVFSYDFRKIRLSETILNNFVKLIYSPMQLIAVSSNGFTRRLQDFTRSNVEFIHAPNWAYELE